VSVAHKFVKQKEVVSHTEHYLRVVGEVIKSAQNFHGDGVRLSRLPESEKFDLWRKVLAQYKFENGVGQFRRSDAKRMVEKVSREQLIDMCIGVFSYKTFLEKI